MNLNLSDDRMEASILLPPMPEPLKLSASDLSELIQHLAWLRANMLPAHEPIDLKPETLISNVPAIRWQVTQDELPGQARLFLLHMGFGWLYIPLHQEAFDDLSQKVRLFLRAPTSIQ